MLLLRASRNNLIIKTPNQKITAPIPLKRSLTTHITRTPLPTRGHTAHLSFTGSKKLPILNPEALQTLTTTLTDLSTTSPSLRALFLRSTIAGADLHYMKAIPHPASASAFITKIATLCRTIQDYRVPVIAVCQGPCLGAGMEVAAACDLRIAVTGDGCSGSGETVFGMPETRVGIPSVVQASLIPGLVGWGRARELLYFGEVIGAQTAREWGFVNEVVEEGKLEERIRVWEGRIDRVGARALRAQKTLMRVWEEEGTGRAGVEAGIRAFAEAYETDEPSGMMNKFFEDRARNKSKS